MHDDWFPVELASGVPVRTAPQEIAHAPEPHPALLEAAEDRSRTLVRTVL